MPPTSLERLRCGVILTGAFQTWFQAWWHAEEDAHAGLIPEIDFVHCVDGPRAGQSWVSLYWRPRGKLGDHELFQIGRVTVHIPRQARLGLKHRCLDVKNGQIVVI